MTEGLRGKTRWWRKTPLEIAHPSRPLLGQDCSLMLFAAGSAAKEQVRGVWIRSQVCVENFQGEEQWSFFAPPHAPCWRHALCCRLCCQGAGELWPFCDMMGGKLVTGTMSAWLDCAPLQTAAGAGLQPHALCGRISRQVAGEHISGEPLLLTSHVKSCMCAVVHCLKPDRIRVQLRTPFAQ